MTAQELVDAALRIDPADRAAYLEEACAGDAALLNEVSMMLASDRLAGDATLTLEPQTQAESESESIGPYVLLQKIGEGGMGVVYRAQQHEPIRRSVALKLIKPGMDSQQVIARFESERQALAVMDHPNIARVFDAGATGRGRPYFVMELVDGIPITAYCDKKGMSIRERIELYIPVCQAIQHAHQKGIIHRDIKPSNVLVKQQEGTATPKVIDFGLAKALANPLGGETAVTEFGSVVGTLDYMSPEQAELGRQDVDTRSDVYSLGALLYELLTGAVPMEYDRASRPSYLDVLRWIQEKPVTPPSERAKQTGQTPEVAEKRGTVPPQLAKLLGRDLDWIIMKALEKDRTRRYETVNGLVRDLQRFLAGEPVEAGPPSAAYRLGKLARKHRVAIAIASSFVVLLSAFAVSIAVTNNRISQGARPRKPGSGDGTAGVVVSDATVRDFEPQRIERQRSDCARTAGPGRGEGQRGTESAAGSAGVAAAQHGAGLRRTWSLCASTAASGGIASIARTGVRSGESRDGGGTAHAVQPAVQHG